MRGGDVGEGEDGVEDRTDGRTEGRNDGRSVGTFTFRPSVFPSFRLKEGQHQLPKPRRQLHPLLVGSRAHHAADDLQPLAEDHAEVRLGNDGPLQKAQHHQAPARGEHGEVVLERRPAQHVEDHVDRHRHLLRERSPRGIDPYIEAQGAEGVELGGGPRGAEHRGAHRPGQLHRGGADAARHGVNQDRLAPLQPAAEGEGVPRGEKRFGNGRRVGPGHSHRHRQRRVLVHYEELGLGAASGQAHHAIPGAPAGRAGPRGVHLAGVFHSGDVGGPPRRRGVLAATLVDVGAVQARRANPDADLTRPGNRVGPLGEREDLRPAGGGIDDCSHAGN